MAPIAKEPEAFTSENSNSGTTSNSGSNSRSNPGSNPGFNPGSSSSSGSAGKSQPAALEISVTVNGARTVQGSEKREPFSESTRTVLVFASGAVIRLASPVAAGQLVFLTNEKTKKEVVCQVVKSRNHSNASGYVELEFTEPSPGCWGMRFPAEAPAQAASPATKVIISPTLTSGPPTKSLKENLDETKAKTPAPSVHTV